MVVCEGSIVHPKKAESKQKHGLGIVLEMNKDNPQEVFVHFEGGLKDWCSKDLLQSGDVWCFCHVGRLLCYE